MPYYTKQRIASDRGVTARTVDNWRARGLLPPPIKLGTAAQSRVRWTAEAVAELDRNLVALGTPSPGTYSPAQQAAA
ncbi:MAG: helix-turn-helix transcriptional regulator [Steroidobacteraceae bacterium]